jgi:phosphatidylserine/phosphatidylglycerophosphate/cardiolipin synthase-like enzyme
VIHHKFVVVDFNGANPVVYTGSSNLSQGGEHNNGDNLLELHGREIASLYAVEAVKIIDHYHFRAAMKSATTDSPLVLQAPGQAKTWFAPYYDPNDLKFLDRQFFAR